jgi:hypothetical protein
MAQPGRPPGPERIPFPLRAEKAILEAVKRCAMADLRSVNAEIEILLREALARRGIRIKPANKDSEDNSNKTAPPPRTRREDR